MPEEIQPSPQGGAVLDIGGDIGALLLHVGPDHLEREVHVAPIDDPDTRTHTVVREHPLPDGRTTVAALFPDLPAGTYYVLGHDVAVTIIGGHVTEQHLPDQVASLDPPHPAT